MTSGNQHSPPAIHLDGETKTLRTSSGPPVAVDDVSLDVARGSVVAFLGPNGAGKTPALDMSPALTTPTSGKLVVLGQTPREAIRTAKISAVLQSGGLLRDLKVGETVDLIASTFSNPISSQE